MKSKSSIDKRLSRLNEEVNKELNKEQKPKVSRISQRLIDLRWKLRKNQDNKCLICENGMPEDAKISYDVGTGQPRGLLCVQCYLGIMNFRQNKKLLERAWTHLDMAVTIRD